MGAVTSADGTTIAYDQVGAGPPLILVDGATQYRAVGETTAALAEIMGERFTVIRYDRRGRGDSGDTLPYAPEREYEDLEALVAEAGGEAHVFSMSSGAVLAVEAASRGVAVSKLVMYEPPMLLDRNGPPPRPDYVETIEGLARDGTPGDAMAYFMAMVGMPEDQVAEFRGSPAFGAFQAVEHTLAYDGRIMEPYSLGEPIPPGAWSGALQPTLVLAGGDSPDWMKNAAQAAAAALPNGEHQVVPGQTHQFAPEALAPVLSDFLSD